MNQKIAYITDLHVDEQFPKDYSVDAHLNWQIILKDVSEKNISKIIYGGDIGELSSNQWFFNTLKDYDLEVTLGNHDKFSEVKKHYKGAMNLTVPELYYSREEEQYKYIFLDSSTGSISKQQFDWLKKELLASKKILLFIHHPILSINTEADRQFALKGREELKQLLLDSNLEIKIFCGHYHMSDYSIQNNVEQYITPASSVQVVKNDREIIFNGDMFGYRIIDFNSNRVETELVLFSHEKV
ncbi:metallophosphoesterase family protein [Chondrinema litorale]|uniref:metallophosphoesterase family protein n=1 Tax=Chondrinema litorale TaxID=2994555 RepID=UPI0025432637|nr:metallophosphoesterase [Chondrinema litorale]UZR99802.1 metallophosphoesterase family protein [Chondrinema litorale]